MDIITLNIKEREKFASYLEQEAKIDIGMVEQMEKLKTPEAIIRYMRVKAQARIVVSKELRNTEEVTL